MLEGQGGNEKDFLVFFFVSGISAPMWRQLLRDALLRVWPQAKCKIPWGLGLMLSPQPFLLATIVSAFVKPVLEVSNSLHALHPKLGRAAWTQG